MEPSVLVLGIGNLLWADEGFGVRAVQALHRRYSFPPNVTLMDGGTQGLALVHLVCQADILVIFDAIDYGLPPGTLKVVRDAEVPKFPGARKMSLHQTGFQEVLALADLSGRLPSHMALIGVQPVELDDYGGSLRDAVRERIGTAIDAALAYLAEFGIVPEARTAPLAAEEGLSGEALDLDIYESGRPAADAACRFGDPRFLPTPHEGEE